MPSSTRTTHHGANHDDRSPTTTVRDALSRSTPPTTRSTSRRPRGKDRHRGNARSNSTESRRRRGKNRRSRNARSSSTEISLPRGEDRRGNRGDRRGRSHDPRSRPRGRRIQSRSKRGRKHSPQRQRDAPTTPKRNRRAYTTEDRLRDERERTNLRDAMYTPQRATPNRGRIAGPPRGDAERSGALRGQHTPANRWGGPQIEAPPLMTAPPRGDAERGGALRSQHTPANLWGGPRSPSIHDSPRSGSVRARARRSPQDHRPATTVDHGGDEVPSVFSSQAKRTYQPQRRPVHYPESRPRPRPYRRATPRGRGKERRASGPTHPCRDTSISVTPTAHFHACFIMYCTSYYYYYYYLFIIYFLAGNQTHDVLPSHVSRPPGPWTHPPRSHMRIATQDFFAFGLPGLS